MLNVSDLAYKLSIHLMVQTDSDFEDAAGAAVADLPHDIQRHAAGSYGHALLPNGYDVAISTVGTR
ncbi:hypothetical protein [Streptomyces mirabilis]|uniref:hypothetical protein n=1 Tax=Streptomyces mirabilis TaxID=68239 RepID=UPI003698C4EF